MKRFPLTVWVYALVIAALLSLPHVIAVANTPQGWRYSGALPIPEGFRVDYNSHMAKMWLGSRAEFAYHLLFTHEDHAALPSVQGFYVVLGAIAGLFRLDFALTYHLARFVLTVGMLLALWRLCVYFLGEREAWLGLLFTTIVTGWGWLLLAIAPLMSANVAPIEFWLIDAYNLIGAFYMPHFAAAILLQILALLVYEDWRQKPRLSLILLLTLILFADAVIQPYVVLLTMPLFALMTVYHVFIGKTLKLTDALWLILPALAHGGIVVYQYLAIASEPIWANFTAQNLTLSPPVLYYLVGYLPFLIPIVLGLFFNGRNILRPYSQISKWLVIMLWLLLVLILLYAPLPTQRRYLLGVQTPLGILAAYAWQKSLANRLGRRWNRLVLIPYFALSLLAPLLLISANSSALASPQTTSAVFYSPDELVAASWIHENRPADALILTSFDTAQRGTGGVVVALTGRRVFLGHWIETADFASKQAELREFYTPEISDTWRIAFLERIGADTLWYDNEAQTYGNWNPNEAEYLTLVFESPSVKLYQFRRNA